LTNFLPHKQRLFIGSCRKIIILTILLFTFLTVNPHCALCDQLNNRVYWPTAGWRTSTPAMLGMDSAKLLRADAFVRERLPDAYSLLVVRNGYLVFEKYYSLGGPDKYELIHFMIGTRLI